jgi:uncharacterized hydrophobic protein (TIGR00271 family)
MNKFTFRKFFKAVNIKDHHNKDFAINNLSKGIYIKGANLWYLICSSLIASIGLDTNSPAVIIGAMLISPLMSPILGIGLSIGIYDKELLFASLKEFLFAVFLSVLISSLYFLISPLGNITNELLVRTTPTLLDIFIAFFGGIAGIVAASRKGVVNSIPGVAIATALMPPICTAGFGLATGTPSIFFGAFYLFFINAVFISLSSFLIVRLLKFPYKEYINTVKESRIKKLIFIIVIVVSIPSFVIFYNIIKNADEQKKIKSFINQTFENRNRNVINWKFQKIDTLKSLRVFYIGNKINKPEQDSLQMLVKEEFGNIELNLQQIDQSYRIENLEKKLTSDVDEKILSLFQNNNSIEQRVKKIEQENLFDVNDTLQINKLKLELEILFPYYKGIDIAKDSTININIKTNLKGNNNIKERTRIKDFIMLRVGNIYGISVE